MSTNKPVVLYVDDEDHNLFSFKSTFRRDYKIFIASSAAQGWKLIQENNIQIVISDQRMPEVTGVEFFERLNKEKPQLIRILLTGFEEFDSVKNAINKGQVYQLLTKPWSEDMLRLAIQNAFDKYNDQILLESQRKQLAEAYNKLDNLVYSAAHDLRGPLTSIYGVTNLCRLEKDKEELHNYYSLIDESAQKLDNVISGIKELSILLRLKLEQKAINFNKIKERVQSEYFRRYPSARLPDIEWCIEYEKDFFNDPTVLKLILKHLVRNAIDFSKENIAQSKVTIEIKQVDHKSCSICVKDNGVGIEKPERLRLYNIFESKLENTSGVGTGLYVVAEAVRKLTGSITLHSVPDEGTQFTVIIPSL